MEGYKPQDFSFFHRSEKLVQQITIGNRVTIGADVLLLDSDGHSLDYKRRGTHDDIPNCKPIVICDDVLIGARTIIGGGSVVSKDIPSDCIAAGNPCKVIKYLNKNSLPCQDDNHSNKNPQLGGGCPKTLKQQPCDV